MSNFVIGVLIIVLISIISLVGIVLSLLSFQDSLEDYNYDIKEVKYRIRSDFFHDDVEENRNELKKLQKNRGKYVLKFISCFLVSCLINATLITGGTHFLRRYKMQSYNNFVTEIVSLKMDSEIQGNFALGSGTIRDINYYYFYKRTSEGYRLDKVKSEETVIDEDDSVTPSLYHIKEAGSYNAYFKLNVPVGTIVKEFKL